MIYSKPVKLPGQIIRAECMLIELGDVPDDGESTICSS